MTIIKRPGHAGTLESNDIMITIAPVKPGMGLRLEISSPVIKQYGQQIHKVISDTLNEHGITEALVQANDKGALDYTIYARVITAISRASI